MTDHNLKLILVKLQSDLVAFSDFPSGLWIDEVRYYSFLSLELKAMPQYSE